MYKISPIASGLSLNNRFYSDKVLRGAVGKGLFENVRVMVPTNDLAHQTGASSSSVSSVIGYTKNSTFIEGTASDQGRVISDFIPLGNNNIISMIDGLFANKSENILQLSIRYIGSADNSKPSNITDIIKIESVDVVINAAAQGKFLTNDFASEGVYEASIIEGFESVIERLNPNSFLVNDPAIELFDRDNDAIVKPVEKNQSQNHETELRIMNENIAEDPAAKVVMTNESTQEAVLSEGHVDTVTVVSPENDADKAANALIQQQMKELQKTTEAARLQMVKHANKMYANDFLSNSTAHKVVKDRVLAYSESILAIEEQKFAKMVAARLTEELNFAQAISNATGNHIELVADASDKRQDRLNKFFLTTGNSRKNQPDNFREILQDFGINFRSPAMLAESINKEDFPNALQTALDTSVQTITTERDSGWRDIVRIVAKQDFGVGMRVGMGHYPELQTRNSQDEILPIVTPAEYAYPTQPVIAYGGFETITRAALYNPNASDFIRAIPLQLINAAVNTLEKHVYKSFSDPAALLAGSPLFSLARKNLYTGTFSSSTFAIIERMLHRQKINADGAYLQLPFHAIAIPVEYKEQAYNMFVRGSNIDPHYVQKMDVKVVATPHLEDPLDWFYFTNPSLHPVIEVGFLNGKEQPEVKIETSPNGKAFYDDRMRIAVTYDYSVSIIGYLGCGKVDGAAP